MEMTKEAVKELEDQVIHMIHNYVPQNTEEDFSVAIKFFYNLNKSLFSAIMDAEFEGRMVDVFIADEGDGYVKILDPKMGAMPAPIPSEEAIRKGVQNWISRWTF